VTNNQPGASEPIIYGLALKTPPSVVDNLVADLCRYHRRIGSRWRGHDVRLQAVLTLAYLEGGHTYRGLTAGNGIPRSTCHTYVQEGIKVLARRALADAPTAQGLLPEVLVVGEPVEPWPELVAPVPVELVDQLWAVGTYVDPNSSINRRKLILQRTGGTWRVSAAPITAAYENLAAVDATGLADAWAVGSATSDIQSAPLVPLALRWNGTSWASMTLPATGSTALTGVDARAPSDVWAVGSSSNADGAQPYVAHFDGISWHSVATPTIAGGGQLTDVVALSPSTVVAVGRSN
jgi:hypothetical protein